MRDDETELSKTLVLKRAIAVEIIGFLGIILLCWVTEYLDPVFHLKEVLIQTAGTIIAGSITIYLSRQFIKRIKYLEGFMVICASCKQIRGTDDEWVPVEQMISSKMDLEFSHGICPECAEKLYGEYLRRPEAILPSFKP